MASLDYLPLSLHYRPGGLQKCVVTGRLQKCVVTGRLQKCVVTGRLQKCVVTGGLRSYLSPHNVIAQ